jgi:hypothetical protein
MHLPARLACRGPTWTAQAGGQLLFYTNGITEVRDARGRSFGTGRLIDFAECSSADGLLAPETLRRLAHD